ncbi:hypothetical protein O181_067353 [Austropuccinia psidii MF-1]|uniref:Uncharacterized protein n=1 Tax=Austropuccinia psidii MF-1 TaxID=1389203 RepID=A0A9Q3EYN0_9BASI|nr:hypothetical protein [Austropuccinia psidii MF-1]
MSSKLTQLTESSPSVPPTYFLFGSGVFSQLGSPWFMASSGSFDPSQVYDGYKAVEFFNPSFNECLEKGKQCSQHLNPRSSKFHHFFVGKKPCQWPGVPLYNIRRYFWSKEDWPFGKELPVSEAPTSDGTSGYSSLTGSRKRDISRWTNVGATIPTDGRPIYSSSEVPIHRINNQGVVKRIRVLDSPTNLDSEGSAELDGEEVEVVSPSIFHLSSTLPTKPPAKKFHSKVILSIPRSFKPVLPTVSSSTPPPSPNPSTYGPALASPIKAIPHSTAQAITSPHFPKIATCFQHQ